MKALAVELAMELAKKTISFTVWMDNLFIDPQVLAFLRHHGIAAAGTMRLSVIAGEKAHQKCRKKRSSDF